MYRKMQDSKAILFHSGKLIDGTGRVVTEKPVLVVEDRIQVTGQAASEQSQVFSDLASVNLKGDLLMPGLIDSHCHISFDEPTTNDELFFHRRAGLATLVAGVNAQKVLRAGVTSILDADCIFEVGVDLRDAIEGGVIAGPRIATGGNALINSIAGTASRLLPDRGRRGYGVVVHTHDEIVREIHSQVKLGVDWIKVHVSGLPLRPNHAQDEIQTWSLDDLKCVCDTAHQLNVPVAGHCRNASSARDAALAGFDLILHATHMDEEATRAVIDKRVPLVPTFTFQANLADFGAAIGADESYCQVFQDEITRSSAALRAVFEAGVPILTGSESGFSITPYGQWHYRELKLFQEHLGMNAEQAIQSATGHGGIAIKRTDDLGRVEAGCLADLLIVDPAVLDDLDLLGRPGTIREIYKSGKSVDVNQPLPETWNIPGWRISEVSNQILTQALANEYLES